MAFWRGLSSVQVPIIVDVTDPEAGLWRKNNDGGDLLTIDTTNMQVHFGDASNVGSAANPLISIIDSSGNIGNGIYSGGVNTLTFTTNATARILLTGGGTLRNQSTGSWSLVNENASATNPIFTRGDAAASGLGGAADVPAIIANSVAAYNASESSGKITNRLSDKTRFSNTAEGNTGSMNIQIAREVHTLAAAGTSDTTAISIPSGALLLGASFNVNTAVVDDAGDDTWTAAFITGDSSNLTPTAGAAAQDSKVNTALVPVKTTDVTQIRFTANGGNFSAGVIEVMAYYMDLTSLANV